jgi:hypothetical protein
MKHSEAMSRLPVQRPPDRRDGVMCQCGLRKLRHHYDSHSPMERDVLDSRFRPHMQTHVCEFLKTLRAWLSGVSVVPPAPPELLRVAPSLTRIEWHAVRDALLFTEQNAGLVSDAHGRAHAKIRETLSLDFGVPTDAPPRKEPE